MSLVSKPQQVQRNFNIRYTCSTFATNFTPGRLHLIEALSLSTMSACVPPQKPFRAAEQQRLTTPEPKYCVATFKQHCTVIDKCGEREIWRVHVPNSGKTSTWRLPTVSEVSNCDALNIARSPMLSSNSAFPTTNKMPSLAKDPQL